MKKTESGYGSVLNESAGSRSGFTEKISDADPGCLSRILIFTHPGSRIQKQQQTRDVKEKFVVIPFL